MRRISWVVIGWLALLPATHSASFDCAKAATDIEKMICGADKLSRLDSDLAAAYEQTLAKTLHRQRLIHEQRQWIHDVRNVCVDAACLSDAYTVRLQELTEPPDLRAAMVRYDTRQQELRHKAFGAMPREIDPSDYHFNYALVDLDGDGILDAVVFFTGREDCGSGGCAMRIMKGTKSGFAYVSGNTITRVPIYVLPSKTNGWSDIAVTVGGGGVGYGMVILKFNGKKYSHTSNLAPSVTVNLDQSGAIRLPLHD